MTEPNDITPETAEKLIRAILDPTGIHGMKPEDPLPLKATLYNAGYLAGAAKADEVVAQIMQVTPDTPPENAKTLYGLVAAYLLEKIEQGTLDEVNGGVFVQTGYPSDDATLVAVMEAGAPEWNEHHGDDYRSGHMAGFLDFLEERLFKVLSDNA